MVRRHSMYSIIIQKRLDTVTMAKKHYKFRVHYTIPNAEARASKIFVTSSEGTVHSYLLTYT